MTRLIFLLAVIGLLIVGAFWAYDPYPLPAENQMKSTVMHRMEEYRAELDADAPAHAKKSARNNVRKVH